MSTDFLAEENKALRSKIYALERELKLRTEETIKLRTELQKLAEIKEKSESQLELIAELRYELEFARAAHASAVEALEIKKKTFDMEHRKHMQSLCARLDNDVAFGGVSPQMTALSGASAGEVMRTAAEPQILYKGSDISSLGFSKIQRPVDFSSNFRNPLNNSNTPQSGYQDEEEVAKVLEMVKDETLMDIKYAEIAMQEELELQKRLEALRRP